MSLLDVANKECQRLRELKHPYTAPELFPSPAIQSTQVMAALFAVEQALSKFKKQYAVLAQQTTNKRRSAICRWKVDAETCSYDTSCGNKWCFPEGTARDNGLRYCPVCGKRASFR